jgi:tripartite-type tricarboxylate transporter receptor subunit TctC
MFRDQPRVRAILLVLALAVLIVSILAGRAVPSTAQAWPTKPIRLVVPFPPGGPTDVVARIYALELAKALGQSVVVDNKAGASGQIGTQDVARALPDGHTLLANASSVVILPHVVTNVLYDIEREFAPVHLMASVPSVLIAPATTKAGTVKELVDGFKAQGKRINYGSSSVGGAMHLAGEQFRTVTGLDMQHIAYKGGGPAIAAVVSGEVPMSFESLPAAMPAIRSGQLKVLAVSAPKRNPALPDVPTMIEQGFAGFDLGSWYGIWAPAKTPPAIVERLNAELVKIARQPETENRFAELGTDPEALGLADLAAFQKREFERWGAIARAANVKAE